MKQFEEWFRYNAQKVFSTSVSLKETCEAFFNAGYNCSTKEQESRICKVCNYSTDMMYCEIICRFIDADFGCNKFRLKEDV